MSFDFQNRPSRKPGSTHDGYNRPTSSTQHRNPPPVNGSSGFSGDSSRFAPSPSPVHKDNGGQTRTYPHTGGSQPSRRPVPSPRPHNSRPAFDWERIVPVLIAIVVAAVVIAALWYYRGAISAFLNQVLEWVFQIILIIVLTALIIRMILRLLIG